MHIMCNLGCPGELIRLFWDAIYTSDSLHVVLRHLVVDLRHVQGVSVVGDCANLFKLGCIQKDQDSCRCMKLP